MVDVSAVPPELRGRIDQLVRSLGNGDPWVRQQAVEALGNFGEHAIPVLTVALQDEAPAVRVEAAWRLAIENPAMAEPRIIEAIRREESEAVRRDMAKVLESFTDHEKVEQLLAECDKGPLPAAGDDRSIVSLPERTSDEYIDTAFAVDISNTIQALDAGDPADYPFIADSLARLGEKAKAALLQGGGKAETARFFVAVAVRCLRHPDESCSDAAREALWNLAPEATAAIPPLVTAFEVGDYWVRKDIGRILAAFGLAAQEAGPILVRLARDEHPVVSHDAYRTLTRIFLPILGHLDYDRDDPSGPGLLQAIERYLGLSSPPEEPPPPPEPLTPAAALRSAAANWPEDVGQRAEAIAAEHLAYRQELSRYLEPILKSQIERVAGADTNLAEKREGAKSINEQLRHYGLAIRCEVRDEDDPSIVRTYPASLVADTPRPTNTSGRLRLEYEDDDGKPKRVNLPDVIKLMASPPIHAGKIQAEASQGFTGRVSRRSGVAARGE